MHSLQPLALIAAKEVRAEGFTIYQVDPETEARELKSSWGTPVPAPDEKGFAVACFPLSAGGVVTGLVAFVFRGGPVTPARRATLERVAGLIAEVWRLSSLPAAYAREAARVAEMETALVDSKIADRARGLLAAGAPPPDAIDTIVRHVESVLRPSPLGTALERLSQETQQEIVERELASRAKEILQRRYGMSEDQAHVHLRLVSRKSRKRLKDVARDLLQEPLAQSGR